MVFECKSSTYGRCSQAGYQPDDMNWDQAWDLLGSCTGTIAPTASPMGVVGGACPDEFSTSTSYSIGDVVSKIFSTVFM